MCSNDIMRLNVIIFLAACVFQADSSSDCGLSLSGILNDKIVGGRNADEGEFPWQASLQKLTWLGFYHTCGAALVTPEWLVTAAHCIRKNSADSYRIVIGSNNLTAVAQDQIYLIQKIIVKQGFDPETFHNDVALIQLFRPVPDFLNPICLTLEAADANSAGVVTGWGATTDGGKASPYLQAADVLIIPRNDCMAYFPDLTETMTCAGYDEGGIDACQGDSGGPLQQWRNGRAFLVGIVSWGVGCAEPRRPGVYTDVIQFDSWIRSYVEQQDS